MPLYARSLLFTGPPDEVAAAVDGHRAHLRELHVRGKLRAAGEFKNGEGFLEIFEAQDLREAQAIGEASPLVSDGLAAWMLREWDELSF
jgi:uncharacterized protein YciI